MALVRMLGADRDALICDLAEVYHIYDYRSVPVTYLSTLCSGLGPDSRIRKKLSKAKASDDQIMLAMIFDAINDLRWSISGDQNDRPKHLFDYLTGKFEIDSEHEEHGKVTYSSGKDFMRARAELLEKKRK